MRRLIAITLSLLCIALPLRSVADAAVNGKHCQRMQAHMQIGVEHGKHVGLQSHKHAGMQAGLHSPASAPADSSGGHDCCNDAATFAKTGQVCKAGQECSAPMMYLLSPSLQPVAVATRRIVIATSSPLHLIRPPAAVWRPPSLG